MNLVFRYRYLLHTLIFALGIFAPWNQVMQIDPPGPNAHVWGLLAVALFRMHVLGIGSAFQLVLSLGIVFAVAGAFLRTWGAAYLGNGVVRSSTMHTGAPAASVQDGMALLEDGPFRYLRNPLYVGTFLHTLALTLLMPGSGAVFAVVLIAALQIVLIVGEERFLTMRLGAVYRAYCKLVPRLWPRLRTKIKGTGIQPRWGQAVLGETYFWAVAVSFAVLGWSSNARILLQGVLVSFGLSLLARAFAPARLQT